MQHYENDVHEPPQEKESLIDMAAKAYKETLEMGDSVTRMLVADLNEQFQHTLREKTCYQQEILSEGWALPKRKRNMNFSQKQKQ